MQLIMIASGTSYLCPSHAACVSLTDCDSHADWSLETDAQTDPQASAEMLRPRDN